MGSESRAIEWRKTTQKKREEPHASIESKEVFTLNRTPALPLTEFRANILDHIAERTDGFNES